MKLSSMALSINLKPDVSDVCVITDGILTLRDGLNFCVYLYLNSLKCYHSLYHNIECH